MILPGNSSIGQNNTTFICIKLILKAAKKLIDNLSISIARNDLLPNYISDFCSQYRTIRTDVGFKSQWFIHRLRLGGQPGGHPTKLGNAHAFISFYHISPKQSLGLPTNMFDKSTPGGLFEVWQTALFLSMAPLHWTVFPIM